MATAEANTETSLTLQATADAIAHAYDSTTVLGRPPVYADPAKVHILLAALAEGNYGETACLLADIPKQSIYNAVKAAEQGNNAASVFVGAIEKAEAMAEGRVVTAWQRSISAGPQYWAAGATFLERKSPDRWGKRTDESAGPKVIVNIGVGVGDVQVTVSPSAVTSTPCIDASTLPELIDVTPARARKRTTQKR